MSKTLIERLEELEKDVTKLKAEFVARETLVHMPVMDILREFHLVPKSDFEEPRTESGPPDGRVARLTFWRKRFPDGR